MIVEGSLPPVATWRISGRREVREHTEADRDELMNRSEVFPTW